MYFQSIHARFDETFHQFQRQNTHHLRYNEHFHMYIGDVLSSRGNYTDNLLHLLKTQIKLPHAWVQIERQDTLTFSDAKQLRTIPRNRKDFEYSNSVLNFHPRLVAPCHRNLIALGL